MYIHTYIHLDSAASRQSSLGRQSTTEILSTRIIEGGRLSQPSDLLIGRTALLFKKKGLLNEIASLAPNSDFETSRIVLYLKKRR
jgi:hypothetical protein